MDPQNVAPLVNAFIIDCDSENTRIGFAPDEEDLWNYRDMETLACAPRQPLPMPLMVGMFGLLYDRYVRIGTTPRGLSIVLRPYRRGRVSDWHAMHAIYGHALRNSPCADDFDQIGVVVCDDARASIEARQYTAQIMFEAHHVPALRLENRSQAALRATGRATGVVVEMAEDGTCVVPVVDGKVLPYSQSTAAAFGAMQASEAFASHPKATDASVVIALPMKSVDGKLGDSRLNATPPKRTVTLPPLSPSLPPSALCFELKQPKLSPFLPTAQHETSYVGGLSTSNFIANLLEERGLQLRCTGERYTLPDITNKCGFCSLSYADFVRDMDLAYRYKWEERWDFQGDHLDFAKVFAPVDCTVNYELPDGQVLTFGFERFLPIESYFHPEIALDLQTPFTEDPTHDQRLDDHELLMRTRFRYKRTCDPRFLRDLNRDKRSWFSKLPRDVVEVIASQACSIYPGLHSLVRSAVEAATTDTLCSCSTSHDPQSTARADLMASLYGNILCCGPGSKLPNIRERLKAELVPLVQRDSDDVQRTPTIDVIGPINPESKVPLPSPWPYPHYYGAGLLAREHLSGRRRIFQTRAEYDEIGRYVEL